LDENIGQGHERGEMAVVQNLAQVDHKGRDGSSEITKKIHAIQAGTEQGGGMPGLVELKQGGIKLLHFCSIGGMRVAVVEKQGCARSKFTEPPEISG
jgi:hypothetical protein